MPDGLSINKKSGIINGKVGECNSIRKLYEITRKNVKSEKKFSLSLTFGKIHFIDFNKSDGIEISKNGKLIKSKICNQNHCYLNIKMENGVYHIKYKFHKVKNDFLFGD